MNENRYVEHKSSECSHSWQRLDEPRASYIDPGVYRCEQCGYTFAEIGALGALTRILRHEQAQDGDVE